MRIFARVLFTAAVTIQSATCILPTDLDRPGARLVRRMSSFPAWAADSRTVYYSDRSGSGITRITINARGCCERGAHDLSLSLSSLLADTTRVGTEIAAGMDRRSAADVVRVLAGRKPAGIAAGWIAARSAAGPLRLADWPEHEVTIAASATRGQRNVVIGSMCSAWRAGIAAASPAITSIKKPAAMKVGASSGCTA